MFEVGKEVVCIKSHSKGRVKKGQRYILRQIKQGICKCAPVVLDVGVNYPLEVRQRINCSICGAKGKVRVDEIFWFAAQLFAPIDNTLSDTTVEEILTEIGELELINE